MFWQKPMDFVKKMLQFIRDVAQDERIPSRDKKVLLGLLAIAVSPIPEWIPVIGVIDEVVLIALICDYLFNVLDDSILLSHYPWDLRSFAQMRKVARVVSFMTPAIIKKWIWKYEPPPY